MKQLKAANDNTPQRAVRDSERPIACPTLARFIKYHDIESVVGLMFWRDLIKPGDPFNPDFKIGAVTYAEELQLQPYMRPERQMNKLFSDRELAYIEAAANDNNGKPTFDSHGQAHLGGLTFQNGKCVTPFVFCDYVEFGRTRTTSEPNHADQLSEEHFNTSLEAEIFRKTLEEEYRSELGDLADVLDMACEDYTAEQIGRRGDESQSAAERHGIRIIDQAIQELIGIKEEKIALAA